ncbi:hypothetical protein H4217_004319 [Coemansia sp. RSA 1939]|nr:hypothetical protein H4217_004319 [Coemansia sp. RSA 1939]KAJ2610071.1 hypothetical protein EV177_004153 [Coemansia sp. RSA 1804]KAJ2691708.1 hypothetical protein GGH99_002221 [Coemansia sp. RSA 1285]
MGYPSKKEAQPLRRTQQQRPGVFGRGRSAGRLLLAVPAAGVMLLCMGAYMRRHSCRMDHHGADADDRVPDASDEAEHLVSNGTHWFRPTLVVVSLDGFRADYLDRGVTPELLQLGKRGLRADYMLPSFPSSTFPNHYTIVTGLYPGSHGIVSNEFYDTRLNDTFMYKDPKCNADARWWDKAEPIWVTAEKQGVKAGINMWPGSTSVIQGQRPTYLEPYANNVPPSAKVDKVLGWLDLSLDKRPSLLATYMPEVDGAAHKMGPNDPSVYNATRLVDSAIGRLVAGIERRNLTGIVNLMVVSDHGMAESHSGDNAIYIDDIIDVSKLRGTYCWPLGGLQVRDEADVPQIYAKLKTASVGQPWTVYLRDEIPARFHYTFASRIAPIFIVPEPPFYVTTRANDAFYSSQLGTFVGPKTGAPMGAHGYDNLHPLMRATFVAAGPAFRSRESAPSVAPVGDGSDTVHIMGSKNAVVSLAPPAQNQVVGDPEAGAVGSRVSDMGAMQDYLELVRSALVSNAHADKKHNEKNKKTPDVASVYHSVNDHLWGDSMLPDAQLRNIRHPPFENVELYGLMARILHLAPAPNNGTAAFSSWWLRQ